MTEPSSRRVDRIDGHVETAFAVFMLLFSIVFIWQSMLIPEPPRNISVGPRTLPLIVGWLMLGVSALLVWRRLREVAPRLFPGAKSEAIELVPLEEEEETAISDWPAVWMVLAAFLAMITLLEPLGFVVTFTLFLFGLASFFGPRHWLRNLIVGACFSLFFYYMFTQILMTPLPNGILSFLF
jgi:putative tricarboxylic transport membrane protein